MRSRILVPITLGVLIGLLAWSPGEARAQTCSAASVKRIKKLNFDAMDENDRWELEKAKKQLEDAKLIAQSRHCLAHPQLAVSYVLLGVVELRSRRLQAMEAAWMKALGIDAKVEIPSRVRSAKVMRYFRVVRAKFQLGARPSPRRTTPGEVVTGPPKGLDHVPLLKWEEGKTLHVTARVANNMGAQRVSLFFKTDAMTAGRRIEFVKQGADKWTWTAEIKGDLLRGKQLKYFIVAYTVGDKEVAASGNSASMHIAQLTTAAVIKRNTGEENPLTGGALPPRRTDGRPVGNRTEDPLEDPNSRPGDTRTPPRAGITRRHRPGGKSTAIFFASVGMGTGIGLMQGKTEVTGEDVPGAPSLGSLYGQFELGYLITRQLSLNIFGRVGGLFISKEVKDPVKYNISTVTEAQGNDKDYAVLLRMRYQSKRLLRATLPINLMWYAGGGVGWGIIRHLVKGQIPDPSNPGTIKRVFDTDKSTGFVPNVFGGVSMCVTKSCAINIYVEMNYLAAFTTDTDLNTAFHIDWTLGANFAF